MAFVMLSVLLAADATVAQAALAAFQRGLECRERQEKSRGHFRAAADGFEELRRRGVRNSALERDLGNAYLLASDLPQAILAYRRGLRLQPNDRVLRANLETARQRVLFLEGSGLGRPPDDRRPPWLPHAPRTLFTGAALSYLAFCVLLTRWYMVRRSRLLGAALVCLTGAAAATVLLVAGGLLESSRPVVVIAADGVRLRKGNGQSFSPRYDTPLNRGVEASLLYRKGGWLQIELSGGEVGWVAADVALVEEGEET
jgi:hypothetical protein